MPLLLAFDENRALSTSCQNAIGGSEMAINVITAARIEAKANEVNKIIGDAILNEYLYRLSQKQIDEFESLIQDAEDYCRQLGGIFVLEEEVGSRFAQLKKQSNETHQELRKWYFKHSPGAKRGHEHDLFEFNKDVMGSLRNWFWLNIRSPEERLNEAVETVSSNKKGFTRSDLYEDVRNEMDHLKLQLQKKETELINWISDETSAMGYLSDLQQTSPHGFAKHDIEHISIDTIFDPVWEDFFKNDVLDSYSYWESEEPQANLFRFFVEGYDCRLWTFRLFPDGLFRTGSWVLDLIGMVSPSCPYAAKTDLGELGDCFEFSTLLFDHVDDSGLTHYFSQLAFRYAGSKCHAIYHVVKGPESDVVSGRPPQLTLSESLLYPNEEESILCSPSSISSLSPSEFELLCKQLVEQMGFEAETTKASGDGGIDVVAYNRQPLLSGKYIIQCKRYSGSVGEPIIRDLYGVVMSERANKGILMTTGRFTKQAIEFADGKPLELVDGQSLEELVRANGFMEALEENANGLRYADAPKKDIDNIIEALRKVYCIAEQTIAWLDDAGVSIEDENLGRYSGLSAISLQKIFDYEMVAFIDYVVRDGAEVSNDEIDFLSRVLGYSDLTKESVESVISLYPEGGGNYIPLSCAFLHAAETNGLLESSDFHVEFYRLVGKGASNVFGGAGELRVERYVDALPDLDED